MVKNIVTYRVIYGDTDQMGVAYYANYLRWFEMGRTELLRQMGMPYASIEDKGLRFPVIEVSCRYLRFARFDETLVIETTLSALGRATLTFNYKLYREQDQAPIATGWTKHACVDQNGEVTKLPPTLMAVLKGALSPPNPDANKPDPG